MKCSYVRKKQVWYVICVEFEKKNAICLMSTLVDLLSEKIDFLEEF